ncbi:MAG: PadR family transcriptional regulator [Salinivirgaceae bacterium]|jgi:PadR family transcriptional regulator PadR|nr:PadR family transcriptional regulator [Salinivirgaceae bacterium]
MIPKELVKGSLKSIVLKLLAENNRMYGYEITQKVDELSSGKIKLSYGALYPVLHKLEKEGAVVTEAEVVKNRNRIYYKLTESGTASAKERIKELEEFMQTVKILLNPQLGFEPCMS